MASGCEWCLRRCGSHSKKYGYPVPVVPLPSGSEVSVGRGLEVTVQLLSKKNQLMLSRKHAVFKQTETGQWTVTDNKSLNGVSVNSSRIAPLKPCNLRAGDQVQLGVITEGEVQAEFVFTLAEESRTPEEVSLILDSYRSQRKGGTAARSDSHKASQESQRSVACKRPSEASCAPDQTSHDLKACPAAGTSSESEPPSAKRTRRAPESPRRVAAEELSARLTEEKRIAEAKAARAQEEHEELSRLLAEQRSARERLEAQLQQRELAVDRALASEKEELEARKRQLGEEMERAVLRQVQAKEAALREQLSLQQEALAEERRRLESGLRQEWEERTAEQERQLEAARAQMASALAAQVREKEAAMMGQLRAQREELLGERQRLESSLRAEWSKELEEKDKTLGQMQEELKATLEEEIKKKEEMMLQQLQTQREALQAEKAKVEENLQREMERKLEEKDKGLQTDLEQEKAKLEEVITQKEREYAELQSELTVSRLEKEAQEVCIQKAKEEALQNISDVMENELQCSICAELFIKATTLNCSHSFCRHCIESWMKRKRECPVCRAAITSHNYSIVLENYIDKMVERLSDDMKQRREAIVQERKGVSTKPGPSSASPASAADDDAIEISSELNSEDFELGIDHSEVVGISDEEDEEEEEDEEDEEDEDDEVTLGSFLRGGRHYYGGGSCFTCGRLGHWSRGCPYR